MTAALVREASDDSNPLPRKHRSNGRVTHIIRGNARGSVPTRRVFLDTEAYIELLPDGSQRQTLWFGWACCERVNRGRTGESTSQEWYRFETAEQFFLWLQTCTDSKGALYIYAHNLQYDAAMLSIATMAQAKGWEITEYVPANHLLWLTMRRDGRSLIFIDTLNYFATSLEKLGDGIGVKKIVIEEHPQPVEWWYDYCKQDVEVIRSAMNSYYKLIREHDLGAYRKTLASQAYGAWRHRFMKHEVLIVADERVEKLERAAYHGGRSEVFYDLPLTTQVYCVDINSMYPWVMQRYSYPCRKLNKGQHIGIDDLITRLQTQLVVAECTLSTEEPCYPYHNGERIIYPVGHFTTTLSTPEIRHAIVYGHLLSVDRWVSYEPAPLFDEFVHTLYNLRLQYKEEGNPAFAYMTKILLNSLYGKFGQRGFHWEKCPYIEVSDETEIVGNCQADGPVLLHRVRFGEMWHRNVDSEAFESFPAIAAHVTAHARMELWHLINIAGREHVYYCDTDSLYTDAHGFRQLQSFIHPSNLGSLKHEGTFQGAHFRAPKDYVVGDYTKIKGIKPRAIQLSPTQYQQLQFESYDQVLARGCDGEIIVRPVVKTLKRRNLQSTGHGVGWRTPLRIDET
jgi:hypothetical protein